MESAIASESYTDEHRAGTALHKEACERFRTCSRVGTSKALGVDNILNIALKAAIRARLDMFLNMYNTCLHERVFPGRWKKQRLVLLPKGKKPSSKPSSLATLHA
ncbi:reverse [Lasius niger]|uniref:Reverse n=1 Tax=Lasius niger TaxID=67767 RepID=A0A0J7KDU1_LASNI|nr:reverse [Lasius niger]